MYFISDVDKLLSVWYLRCTLHLAFVCFWEHLFHEQFYVTLLSLEWERQRYSLEIFAMELQANLCANCSNVTAESQKPMFSAASDLLWVWSYCFLVVVHTPRGFPCVLQSHEKWGQKFSSPVLNLAISPEKVLILGRAVWPVCQLWYDTVSLSKCTVAISIVARGPKWDKNRSWLWNLKSWKSGDFCSDIWVGTLNTHPSL